MPNKLQGSIFAVAIQQCPKVGFLLRLVLLAFASEGTYCQAAATIHADGLTLSQLLPGSFHSRAVQDFQSSIPGSALSDVFPLDNSRISYRVNERTNVAWMSIDFPPPVPALDASSLGLTADWYLVRLGDRLTRDSIAEDQFPTLLNWSYNKTLAYVERTVDEVVADQTYISNRPIEQVDPPGSPTRLMPLFPSEFYLGFATGMMSIDKEEVPVRNTFGWVRLRVEFSRNRSLPYSLSVVDSGAVSGANGVVIGSLWSVPEPTGAAMLLGFASATLLRRHR